METGLSGERDFSANSVSSPSLVGTHPKPGNVEVG